MAITEAAKIRQRRYRERHRDEVRAAGREYAARKRREVGMPMLGTPESTENRRRARKLAGAAHPNWAGDSVSYIALHAWVVRHKPRTGTCDACGATPVPKKRRVATEFANISGEYRRDVADYRELCVSCHRKADMTDEKRRKISEANRRRYAHG